MRHFFSFITEKHEVYRSPPGTVIESLDVVAVEIASGLVVKAAPSITPARQFS